MISSAHLPRPASLLAGAILLLVGLFAGACDQMTGSSLGDVEGPPEVDSAALSYSHMPTGTSLPSPGEVPLTNGIIGAEGETPRPKNDSPKTDSSGVESPYGCYLASRPYTDSTRIRSVYLYFPAEMVEAAEGKTKSFVLQMSVAWGGGEADARYAHCVVPEVPGAREVATGQLLRAGEEDAAWGVAGGGSKSASAKGCIQIVYTATTCVGGGGSFPEEHCETETESVTVCGGGDGGGGDGGATDPWPDYDGGGGGSDGSGGDSGEDCTAPDPEPGSDCEPADPCESDDPPSYCEIDIPCKLSAPDLVDGVYLYDQASESARKDFISTLEEHGSDYGLDSKSDFRHFIAQTAHESQGAITKVENLNYQDAENLAATFSEFSIDGKRGKYKASDYIGKPKEIAKIAYADVLGNGEKGSGDA